MKITEVRIKLVEEPNERLQAFCSITIDHCFVIRDLKIIEGVNGPFVAMPSRKLAAHCGECGCKNHLRAKYCNECGKRLEIEEPPVDRDGRAKLYADIAHPINSECREMIQDRVIQSFRSEQELAKQPDYISRYDEGYVDDLPPPPRRTPAVANEGRDDGMRRRTDRGGRDVGGGPHRSNARSARQEKQVESDGGFGAGVFEDD